MEIYKETNTAETKEFEKLLNNQISKTKNLNEGKIIEGTVTKIGEKYIFLFIEGLKSEPMVDINELKTLGQENKLKVGEKIQVLLERIEDKNGEVIVSASKAQKIKGWDKLVEAYEKNQPILLVDVGTNTEIILGMPGKIYAASCPAGPAFEGGDITYGMPGYDGAIEKISVNSDSSTSFKVIGGTKPVGICGSGLIDLLAELRKSNIMNELGRLENNSKEIHQQKIIVDKMNKIKSFLIHLKEQL